MAKVTLILLHLLTLNALLAYSQVPDFIQIGSFDSSNDYYVRKELVSFADADASCKLTFGDSASTVVIDSSDEWNYLQNQLLTNVPCGCGRKYWTNGEYDSTLSQWIWADNDQSISPIAWSNGQPTSSPNADSRVLINYRSSRVPAWNTAPDSETHCYICEVPRTDAVPCLTTTDLVVLLDSSGSIGSGNYDTAKSFVNDFVTAFTAETSSRVAFIIFSDAVTTIIHLTNTDTPVQISSEILGAPYLASDTNTDLGIDASVAEFNSSLLSVPRNLVVLTDGQSTNPPATVIAANAAIALGIRTFAVGIGSATDQTELLTIANGNQTRVFNTNSYADLVDILNPLSRRVCPDE